MAYINEYILDQCAGYGWQGGPSFKTTIVEMANGRERRNAEWAQPRHQYQAPFNNISREDYIEIKTAHLNCQGQLHAFRFHDELDNQLDNELFGVGNGVRTVFQLLKQSIMDGVPYQRNIYAPDSPLVIRNNGSIVTPTIDYERGTVTFSVAPSNGNSLTATGTFGVWVRFNQDYLPFSIDNGASATVKYMNGSVDLIEVPPPESP